MLQTLTKLEFHNNQIGDQVAEHLDNALQQNKVKRFVSLSFLFNHLFAFFSQTLKDFYLLDNQIDAEVAKHFANTLRLNQVT